MTKLFNRRDLSAEEVLNLEWIDAYRIEREIKEDLDRIER